MKITVTDRANKWLVEEMDLQKGDAVRFLGKLYGKTEIHDNFSVGLRIDEPRDVLAEQTIEGITYFIEEIDDWFFSGYDFEVVYNENTDELDYKFSKQ
ncbi:iron-sulfur cluster biosynthesis protein [Oceanobacillus piezotolerans]|uniref:Iron-sulfur cluster biosynthesis protein n=1 Tax=Oceanobacillus piezotolerans TaxID=2448030 RepID=A0A498DCL3_9BACI|nr:iron-sulfur cluster biosynthesis protein [Oceanobacillus piezotolerans]RLL47786.1 iron-sulfur cluster biosynthesis protein [Oceanobacillus piezotolerans]